MKLKGTALIVSTLLVACDGVDSERAAAQAQAVGNEMCTVTGPSTPLPDEVRESSGLAIGASGLSWTHNDAGNPAELFALDNAGRLVQRVLVTGAESVDWEDIEAAQCDDGDCLYIGDIGDNDGERDHITIYVIPEPGRNATASAPARAVHARYPDGPRDAEGLFVAPGGDIYIVTKGRAEAVELYRLAANRGAAAMVTLERIRELFPQPDSRDRVSAATMSPDGQWVAIRNYRTMFLYRAAELLDRSADAVPVTVDLQPLGHQQGESIAIAADGTVRVSSEAENRGSQPVWGSLSCTFR